MMTIDIKEIIDYCRCPMFYKFRYIDHAREIKVINILEKYDRDIHKTIYAFFSYIQDEGKISINNFKRVWGSHWIGAKTPSDILYSDTASWRDTHNQQRIRGIDVIVNIYNHFKKNPGLPIVINQPYEVSLSKNLILTGTWEIIREVEYHDQKFIELIDFKTGDRSHNEININKDFEITAASYAFQKTFETREDRILYYGLDKNKIHVTNRTDEDHQVFLQSVVRVAKAIEQNLFYACPLNKCVTCPYKNACLKY